MSENQDRFNASCAQFCRDLGWDHLPNGIRVTFSGGRRQLVALDFFEQQDQEFVRMSTRIGPVEELDEDRLVSALRVNAGLAHGAIAVIHDDLVMVDTKMLSDAKPSDVSASIGYLARTADAYEKTLFNADAY
jgi:hypothetical protein